jgi:hypothetical protein
MPKTTTTTVSQNANGQYQVTIPKHLGDALELDGKELAWRIGTSTNKLEAEIYDE